VITVLIAAMALAAILIAASLAGSRGGGGSVPPPSSIPSSGWLAGIPQQGVALGRPDAPATLVVYADPQCPYCAEWERTALRPLVDRYVREGKLRIEYRGIAIVGPNSVQGLRYFAAASEQNRMWNVLTASYAAQGAENSGWITPALFRAIGAKVPGLDISRMLSDAGSSAVTQQMQATAQQAAGDGVSSTPSFLVGRTGGDLRAVSVDALTAQALEPAINQALAQPS
jgi:protein-disulfide isomerase